MATLADVAALARVSKATASRAFTRPEVVSLATAARVRDAAKKLNFVPNLAARQLAGGRTGVVALIVPTLDNSFFTPIIGGAQRRAAAAGLQLTIGVHPLESAAELVGFDQLSRQVDGFIIVAPRGSDDLLLAAGSHKPTVLVDREVDGLPSVVADTATAFAGVVESFAARGHAHQLYVGGPEGSWQDRQRVVAIKRAAATSGVRLTILGPYPATFAAGVEAASAVRDSGATAVLPYATAIGLGIQYALLSAGVTERPVSSSERTIIDALGLSGVPAIDVDGEALGAMSADQLIDRIAEPRSLVVRSRVDVPVRWSAE